MLWMTFLSGTNPLIRQKIPLDVSSCHLQRAPGTGIPASGRLSGTLTESTLADEAEGSGGMMVRFPTIRRLTVARSTFSKELRTNSP